MADVNRAFEIAVRRDPANWFWVHDRWKRSKAEAENAKSENSSPQSTVTGEALAARMEDGG